MESYHQFLNKNKLFAGLSESQISTIIDHSKIIKLEKQEIICRQGDPADTIFILLEGHIEILVRKKAEKESYYHVATYAPGAIMGEIALLLQTKRSAAMRAGKEPATLCCIPITFLFSLKRSDNPKDQLIYYMIIENIAFELCDKVADTNKNLVNVLNKQSTSKDSQSQIWTNFGNLWAGI